MDSRMLQAVGLTLLVLSLMTTSNARLRTPLDYSEPSLFNGWQTTPSDESQTTPSTPDASTSDGSQTTTPPTSDVTPPSTSDGSQTTTSPTPNVTPPSTSDGSQTTTPTPDVTPTSPSDGSPTSNTRFDVTKYGAVADGTTNNAQAFLKAWTATCSYNGNASFYVPKGNFLLGPIILKGPCTSNTWTGIWIEGTLKALPDLEAFPDMGWIELNGFHEIFVGGGGTLDGQGASAWPMTTCTHQRKCRNLPVSLRVIEVNNATVSNLNLVNSKGFHVNFHMCVGIQVHSLTISAPGDSPNTDGIHISGTNNIIISHTKIGTGDDCISIGPGSTNVKISEVTCGPGHGISVGSLGKYPNEKEVFGVNVQNCTLQETTNGLRIKSWPGSSPGVAQNFTFEDISMVNVSNPIIIDQHYCPVRQCTTEPSLVKISNVKFRRVSGTTNSPSAVNLQCSKSVPCNNINLEDINLRHIDSGVKVNSNCTNLVASVFSGQQEPAPCAT